MKLNRSQLNDWLTEIDTKRRILESELNIDRDIKYYKLDIPYTLTETERITKSEAVYLLGGRQAFLLEVLTNDSIQ